MSEQATPTLPHTAAKTGWQVGFWSLIVTQFQNAFNDNAIKFLVIYIIVAMNFPKDTRENLILIVGALFALPFIFFSMAGGNLADRYSKRSVVIGTKLMEIFVMAVTILGLWLQNLPLECAAVFLISSQSALFGPVEIRPAAGVGAGTQTLLGQRNHRIGNFSWQHHRGDGRRRFSRALPRP